MVATAVLLDSASPVAPRRLVVLVKAPWLVFLGLKQVVKAGGKHVAGRPVWEVRVSALYVNNEKTTVTVLVGIQETSVGGQGVTYVTVSGKILFHTAVNDATASVHVPTAFLLDPFMVAKPCDLDVEIVVRQVVMVSAKVIDIQTAVM